MTAAGLLILRLVIGGILFGHGAQKLFGWWGGPGLDGWTQAMTRMRIRPARPWALISAFGEVGGGILLALDAYRASLNGRVAPVLDGFTGEQRVFLGWAQVWRSKGRLDALKRQVASDPHSPSRFRVDGPMRNVDAWYDAFGVKPGDKLFLKPGDRVHIW